MKKKAGIAIFIPDKTDCLPITEIKKTKRAKRGLHNDEVFDSSRFNCPNYTYFEN